MNRDTGWNQALQRLMAGNRRYISGQHQLDTRIAAADLAVLSSGQAPFAAILGCADSRVPVEIVFDQGLGDLFVVRVAGNIVAPSQIGSIEYAVERFGTRLVMVLGHSGCGAVAAALEFSDPDHAPGQVGTIVSRIHPCLAGLPENPSQRFEQAVIANVRHSVAQLRRDSEILEEAIADDMVAVVGAVYDLGSGAVTLVDS